jgi:hypothetical protein
MAASFSPARPGKGAEALLNLPAQDNQLALSQALT